MTHTRSAIIALAAVFVVAACGDDDDVSGPQIADLAGFYTATQFEFTSDADAQTSFDLTDLGEATATIGEPDSDSFRAEIPVPGTRVILTGTIDIVDENTLQVNFNEATEALLDQAGLPFEDFSAEFELDGDIFTWLVTESSFDFNGDGQAVPANLNVRFVRQD